LLVSVTDRSNDARNMEGITHIPAPVWAVTWFVISAVILMVSLKSAWARAPRSRG
jgi:hypothetical protein